MRTLHSAHQGGWWCDMETVNQKSCPSPASDSCQQVRDVFCQQVRDVFCHQVRDVFGQQEGQGEPCHYSQFWTSYQLPGGYSGQLTQALPGGVIQACTDPQSQMKPCMSPSDGRAQGCSLLLPQSLAHSEASPCGQALCAEPDSPAPSFSDGNSCAQSDLTAK